MNDTVHTCVTLEVFICYCLVRAESRDWIFFFTSVPTVPDT